MPATKPGSRPSSPSPKRSKGMKGREYICLVYMRGREVFVDDVCVCLLFILGVGKRSHNTLSVEVTKTIF